MILPTLFSGNHANLLFFRAIIIVTLLSSHFSSASTSINKTSNHGQCTLCKDGSIPADLDSIVMVDDGEPMTCGDFLQLAPTFSDSPDRCEILQAMGASLCGCPIPERGEQQEPECTLCQDGSPIPNVNQTIGQEAFSCGVIETFVRSDTRPGACEAYQLTAGAYCGCAVDESAATIKVCSICPDGMALPDPGRLVLDDEHEEGGGFRTCASVEFDATFFPEKCSAFRAEYQTACCQPEFIVAPPLISSI